MRSNSFGSSIIKGFTILSISVVLCCTVQETRDMTPQEIAVAWADMALYLSKNTPSNSPTYASRALAYIGLTMYESLVHGFPSYRSLAGQLNELESLPKPDPNAAYNWLISLNAGQAHILKHIYVQTSDSNKIKIDSLKELIHYSIASRIKDKDEIERSELFGENIAEVIFKWSKTDGGHRGYLKNFDKSLAHPDHPGAWKPPLYAQSFSHHPLHPHWGKNRVFIPENENISDPEIIPYNTSPQSRYYQQFLSVYEKEKALTQEEKEIAIWWGDDPSETFTPPGHSYYIATLAVRKLNPDLIKCAETFARVGLAVADAFIKCWKWKYHFFSERPNTFIPQVIDEEWTSFWPDPPFPSFPSGHAIQAASAATVLEDLYGENFAFTDSAHVGRKRDELRNTDFRERSFTTFWGVAEETANSRFYGGIHTPQDNNVGLEKGKIIGNNVNALSWRRETK